MANKKVSQLPAATTIDDNDLLVVEQGQTAKRLTGGLLRNYTTADIVSAVAETLEAGASATAAYNVAQRKLTIGVPKGDKGDKGEKGDVGAEGKSAYQIAVQDGFEGTEQEWLRSLQGEQGIAGSKVFSPVVRVNSGASTVLEVDSHDAGKMYVIAQNETDPTDTTVRIRAETYSDVYDVNAEIEFVRLSSARVVFQPDSGVTIENYFAMTPEIVSVGHAARLKRIGENQWLLLEGSDASAASGRFANYLVTPTTSIANEPDGGWFVGGSDGGNTHRRIVSYMKPAYLSESTKLYVNTCVNSSTGREYEQSRYCYCDLIYMRGAGIEIIPLPGVTVHSEAGTLTGIHPFGDTDNRFILRGNNRFAQLIYLLEGEWLLLGTVEQIDADGNVVNNNG